MLRPSTSRAAPPVGPSRTPVTLGTVLILGYVVMLPVQFGVGPVRAGPSDGFLLLYLLLRFPDLRHVRAAWSAWHAALVGAFGISLCVALVRTGELTGYALGQKSLGLVFLLLSYVSLVDYCSSVQRLVQVLRWFVLGATVNAAVALAAFALQVTGSLSTDSINFAGARVSGFLIDPNAFGGVMVTALVLHLWTWSTPTRVWTWPGGGLVSLIMLVALVLTFSRSAWIAFVVAVGTALVLRGAAGLRPLPKLVSLGIATAMTVGVALVPTVLWLVLRPDQVSGRLDILRNAAADFLDSPIFGIGLGTFQERHNSNIVHNTTAWIAAEFGVIGLIAFLGFVSWFIVGLLRVIGSGPHNLRHLALAVLLGQTALLGLSVGIEAFYQRYWWLLFAAAATLFSLMDAAPASVTERSTTTAQPPQRRRTPV